MTLKFKQLQHLVLNICISNLVHVSISLNHFCKIIIRSFRWQTQMRKFFNGLFCCSLSLIITIMKTMSIKLQSKSVNSPLTCKLLLDYSGLEKLLSNISVPGYHQVLTPSSWSIIFNQIERESMHFTELTNAVLV